MAKTRRYSSESYNGRYFQNQVNFFYYRDKLPKTELIRLGLPIRLVNALPVYRNKVFHSQTKLTCEHIKYLCKQYNLKYTEYHKIFDDHYNTIFVHFYIPVVNLIIRLKEANTMFTKENEYIKQKHRLLIIDRTKFDVDTLNNIFYKMMTGNDSVMET